MNIHDRPLEHEVQMILCEGGVTKGHDVHSFTSVCLPEAAGSQDERFRVMKTGGQGEVPAPICLKLGGSCHPCLPRSLALEQPCCELDIHFHCLLHKYY